jgi:hypothetical protein
MAQSSSLCSPLPDGADDGSRRPLPLAVLGFSETPDAASA